jgi:hypothetical protein
MIDLYNNTTQHGLLKQIDPEGAKALEECGGPWEFWSPVKRAWLPITVRAGWSSDVAYRKAREPDPLSEENVEAVRAEFKQLTGANEGSSTASYAMARYLACKKVLG